MPTIELPDGDYGFGRLEGCTITVDDEANDGWVVVPNDEMRWSPDDERAEGTTNRGDA